MIPTSNRAHRFQNTHLGHCSLGHYTLCHDALLSKGALDYALVLEASSRSDHRLACEQSSDISSPQGILLLAHNVAE